ncbi:MAG: MoaD/ThiS family protein [Candidatus Bathyarchaeia archaeon]
MRVKVIYLGVVRHKVGRSEEEFELEDNAFLRDLILKIIGEHGALKDMVSSLGESPIDPTLIVTLNGLAVNLASGNNIKLKDGDTLALMTVIGGG